MSEIVGYGTLTEENAAQWWHEVYERLIKPHEEDVDRIFGYGAVAVVVDVVEVESAERARVEAGMRNMGWDGDATAAAPASRPPLPRQREGAEEAQAPQGGACGAAGAGGRAGAAA